MANSIQWGELTVEQFLAEYWQKKPLIIKNALPNFTDTIDANELAGLAMEEEIESRIISQDTTNNWHVSHGPFDSFDSFGETHWTLLVQAVNNWSRKTDQLISLFNFIPRWRIDDVMVSYSTPNGGVGSHLDQYDVFILQGSGQRRWRVGAKNPDIATLIPHPDLKQVVDFIPVIDEITESGDLLYIPPNHPHNGVSIENSLNFSIGFQAPNSQDLWSSFADKVIDEQLGEQRFTDQDRQVASSSSLLAENDVKALKAFMLKQLDNEDMFAAFISQHLTQSHHTLELLIPVEPFTDEQVRSMCKDESIHFAPVSGIKSLIVLDPKPYLFINGDKFVLSDQTLKFAQVLAKSEPLTTKNAESFLDCLKNEQLLTMVLNKGYWYIE
jgi:50S ribosomal protein L16 3-hydroxylase